MRAGVRFGMSGTECEWSGLGLAVNPLIMSFVLADHCKNCQCHWACTWVRAASSQDPGSFGSDGLYGRRMGLVVQVHLDCVGTRVPHNIPCELPITTSCLQPRTEVCD